MGFHNILLLAGLLPQLTAASLFGRDSAGNVTCNYSMAASSGDTCDSFAASWGLTTDAFAALNPGATCPGDLVGGTKYCVIGTAPSTTSVSSVISSATSEPASSLSASATSSAPAATSSVPTVVVCDFSASANTNDTCASFSGQWGISSVQFQALNPDTACPTALVDGQDYCIIGTLTPITGTNGTANATATTAAASTSTSFDDGAPSPTQSGITNNCRSYYRVTASDSCSSIESRFNVSSADFLSWNPALALNSCADITTGYYVCVSIFSDASSSVSASDSATATSSEIISTSIAETTTSSSTSITSATSTTFTPTSTKTTSTSTTPTSSSSVPSPTQSGIVSNCNKFHEVVSGDYCYAIETTYGISSADFLAWNPSIDADCTNLWLGYYVCVGVSS